MKRLAIVSVLALSACEGKQAPTACGPIAQVAVNAGETVVVTACFTDANEDMLSYTATSSNRLQLPRSRSPARRSPSRGWRRATPR